MGDIDSSAPNQTILGYDWDDIQRAQQGGRLSRAVDTMAPINNAPSDADRALLAEHGADGLRFLELWGVIDRLQRAGEME